MNVIETLKALHDKATPVPWIAALSDDPSGTSSYRERFALWTNKGPRCVTVDKSTCIAADDALLITAMRNALPDLLAVVEAAQELAFLKSEKEWIEANADEEWTPEWEKRDAYYKQKKQPAWESLRTALSRLTSTPLKDAIPNA